MKKNAAAMTMPESVICLSPNLTPSKYSTDRPYADTRQLRAKISYICCVVASVHRPCRMIVAQDSMLIFFEVKGEAMDASPSLTSFGSSSPMSSSSSFICLSNFSLSSLLLRSSGDKASNPLELLVCPLAEDDAAALTLFELPAAVGPFFVADFSADDLALAADFCPASPRFCIRIIAADVSLGPLGCFEETKDSSATPTCACFRAPTSFVPSPHINVSRPCSL
mmetsp:Transcript_3189/g.9720  ORF Transcript_3189/g.9720 Transcript_3189/m.9720 type:complete len:224 (-) Transcript_3189:2575-3246(-)